MAAAAHDVLSQASTATADGELQMDAPIVTDADFRVNADADRANRGGNPCRHWVFTIQVDSDDEAVQAIREEWIPPAAAVNSRLRYIVCQRERGNGTGRLHWQGYLQLGNPCRHTQVRTILACPWAWVKPARGTPAQCRAYCTKLDTREPGTEPYESGAIAENQGKRSDLVDVFDLVKSGAKTAEVLEAFPASYIRYHSGIERAIYVQQQARAASVERDMDVVVVWGPPGTGKTRYVYDTYGYDDTYTLNVSVGKVWWNGYHGQKNVVVDDFAGGLPYRYLLTLTDRYPMQVETKGGMVYLQCTRVVFTSNLHWSDWYQRDEQAKRDIRALQRRITKVVHVPVFGAVPEIQERGLPASDPANWVTLPEAAPLAPGFLPPPVGLHH